MQHSRVLDLVIKAVRLKGKRQKVEIVGGNSTCGTLLLHVLINRTFTPPNTTLNGKYEVV